MPVGFARKSLAGAQASPNAAAADAATLDAATADDRAGRAQGLILEASFRHAPIEGPQARIWVGRSFDDGAAEAASVVNLAGKLAERFECEYREAMGDAIHAEDCPIAVVFRGTWRARRWCNQQGAWVESQELDGEAWGMARRGPATKPTATEPTATEPAGRNSDYHQAPQETDPFNRDWDPLPNL